MRLSLLLLFIAPYSGFAADFRICGRDLDAANPLAWESLEKKYSAQLADRKFTPVLEQLLKDFQSSPKQSNPAIKAVFEARAKDVIQKKTPCCPDFALAMQPAASALDDDKPVLFGGQIDLSVCDGTHADQNDELRYYAHAFENIGNLEMAPQRMKTAAALRDIEKDFDQLLFQGFPMFPWEALANSWILTDKQMAKGAPYDQLVLGHMSVGASAPTERFSKARLGWGLAVEPLGWVHYPRSGKHQRWWGVASLIFLRNGEGLGAGFALRYNQFSAGLTWHDSNDNNRLFDSTPHVFIGLDVYQFAGKKIRQYSEITDRIKKDVEAVRSGVPTQQVQ